MTTDLADRAERRAAFAALAGALLLSEPGPTTAPLVAKVPELALLADSATAVDYERVLLRGVPPYESIFRSDTAERGGVVSARVADHFDDLGFDEHRSARWRVAGPDHLGLQLRAHAFLIGLEAAAWRGERPDEAARHVEAQRQLFADHVAWWAPLALDAIAVSGAHTPYAGLASSIDEFLRDEFDLLRPLPLLDTSQLPLVAVAARMGPRRLARHLMAPARCGMWLGLDDIANAAHQLGFPWRPMDGRGHLVPLVAAAHEAGELAALVKPWGERAARAQRQYEQRAAIEPGAEVMWRHMSALAGATTSLLATVAASDMTVDDDTEVVFRVAGARAKDALEVLRAQGLEVEIVDTAHDE